MQAEANWRNAIRVQARDRDTQKGAVGHLLDHVREPCKRAPPATFPKTPLTLTGYLDGRGSGCRHLMDHAQHCCAPIG